MGNLSAFLGYFVSYLILFGVFVAIAIVGSFIGITIRKNKNAQEPEEAVSEGTNA